MKKYIFSSVALFAVVALPLSVLAHEHQAFMIGDKTYEFTVGSLNEPIVVGDKTGVDFRVVEVEGVSGHDEEEAGKPVAGLETALKVEVNAGGQKMVQNLSPAFGVPGSYKTTFYPSAQTTYSYRFFGTINNTPVDLTFTCNPAGHPVTPEDGTELKMSEGVTRIKKAGSFGCPLAKDNLVFPPGGASSSVEDGKALSGVNDQVVFVQFLTLIAIVLGIGGMTAGVGAMMGYWTIRRK